MSSVLNVAHGAVPMDEFHAGLAREQMQPLGDIMRKLAAFAPK